MLGTKTTLLSLVLGMAAPTGATTVRADEGLPTYDEALQAAQLFDQAAASMNKVINQYYGGGHGPGRFIPEDDSQAEIAALAVAKSSQDLAGVQREFARALLNGTSDVYSLKDDVCNRGANIRLQCDVGREAADAAPTNFFTHQPFDDSEAPVVAGMNLDKCP